MVISEPDGAVGIARDPISGLPDRAGFYAALREFVARSDGNASGAFVVILLDVHGIDDVLVALGPRMRDQMIAVAARRVGEALGSADALLFHVRFDRFALILPEVRMPDAVAAGLQIARNVAQSIVIDLIPLISGATFGVARYPNHGTSADELARAAAIALRHAALSEEGYAIFDVNWAAEHRERYLLLTELREQLQAKKGICLHYQPKVELATDRCIGVEGLLRWEHPERGLIAPGQFIPFVEDTALIHLLTEEVLTQGLEQLSRWTVAGKEFDLSINLSARNLVEPGFAEMIADTIRFYGSDPRRLEFEVTESAIMQNPYQSGIALRRLKELGACVAIDDFGVGQSSLSYLVELPVDTLKIDRSFVSALDDQPRNQAVIRAAITLAHELGMRVVAEGIENEETYRRLRDWECDMGQGYLIGRPQAEPEIRYPAVRRL